MLAVIVRSCLVGVIVAARFLPKILTPTACLAGLILLVACGSDQGAAGDIGQKVTGEDLPQIDAADELVRLRLKRLERADRLPPSSGKAPALTLKDLTSEVAPVSQPGEGWEYEDLAAAALAQLKRLAKAEEPGELDDLLADGFRSNDLTPQASPLDDGARALLEEGGYILDVGGGHSEQSTVELGRAGLIEALGKLGELHFKVVGVRRGNLTIGGVITRVQVEAGSGNMEHSAIWNCEWVVAGAPPRLLQIHVEDLVTVQAQGPWFADVTRAAIGGNPRFDAQVMRGIEYWSQRITRIGDLAMTGHHGIAVGDVNGDGLEDVYVCDGGSLPNQLYVQRPDGSAAEVAAEWDVAWLEDSRSALLVDLDNDGDQDLVVATIAMLAIAENDGAGKFVLRGGHPGAPYPFSLSAADFDNDGDLDLYTCVYSAGDESVSGKRGFEARSPVPFNDANNGGRNVLLANLGGFQFADVTEQVGLDQNNTRWSFAAAWEDFDRDGDVDLYVANDFGRNSLYRNEAGRFRDVAAEFGVEDMAAGMSVAWGDFDRDGEADLYVGNMFSAAGRRVGYQRDFGAGLQRMARGNTLFASRAGKFADVSETARVVNGGWAWSSAFADLDNDGWEDLVVANGYLSNTRDDDL